MKKGYPAFIVSIAGVTVLYLLSIVIQPIPISLDKLPAFEGKQVEVTGIVTDIVLTTYNHQIISIRNIQTEPVANAIIFSEEPVDVDVDDVVTVQGKVQRYGKRWEIVVKDGSNIEISAPVAPSRVPLWRLSQDPEQYKNLPVSITGRVKSDTLSDAAFTLYDETRKYRITVLASPSALLDAEEGDRVLANGRLLYDSTRFSYYFLADKVMKVD
ncbi:MAG TPA: hypothetical protein EYP23_06005 [Thermoplasmata archaeon]|nr:hypothetical protein [Thermoplasmata archaeon]